MFRLSLILLLLLVILFAYYVSYVSPSFFFIDHDLSNPFAPRIINIDENKTKYDQILNKQPYLIYTKSGGIVGYALKLNIYKNYRYEVFDNDKLQNRGILDDEQMSHIDNIVNTINRITEKDTLRVISSTPIIGNDILYLTLKTQQNTVSMEMYEKYKKNDKEIELLETLIRSRS